VFQGCSSHDASSWKDLRKLDDALIARLGMSPRIDIQHVDVRAFLLISTMESAADLVWSLTLCSATSLHQPQCSNLDADESLTSDKQEWRSRNPRAWSCV
jgi:hypothetical protein